MKKQTTLRLIILSSLLMLAMTLTAFAQDNAQEQTAYKVGDRVEVDPQAYDISNKSKKWHKATVTKIGPSGGGVYGYYVSVDAEGDSGPTDAYVRTGQSMIRPLQGPEKKASTKGADSQEQKVAPGKELPKPASNACQPSDVISGTSQSDIFERLIQDRYLHKPEGEQDYTAYVTFQTFKLGATHKWRPGIGGESPDGPGGRAGTTVYPVKAVYLVCKDHPGYAPTGYRGDIEKRQDDNNFYCFKNQFGEWQCNLGEGTMGKVIWTKK